MVITIDGPAGTGKSTVAQALAQRRKFDFLDTGARYGGVGIVAVCRTVDLDDARELTFVARHSKIDFDWDKHPPTVLLNGDAVGHLLRGGDATKAASYVAVVPQIREMLVAQQQRIGSERKNLVTEGRDQGTIVFPKAEFKFYLDATPQERAKRRAAQLRSRGEIVDIAEILEQIVARDTRDKSRAIGPLSVPKDAEVIDTTKLSQAQVIEHMVARVNAGAAR